MGIRHLQCFFIFLAITVVYAMRVNINVAILAMTDKTYSNPNQREYDWSEQAKSMVLSSFYWGYTITQLPGGLLAVMFGGKVVLSCGVLASSTMAIILPTCADIGGWKLVCGVRVVDGLSQGVVFPSLYAIMGQWCPIEERGLFSALSFTGVQVGTFTMTIGSGFLAVSSLGWPFVFYIPGACGIAWTLCFYIWGASSPSESKIISIEEKNLIDASLGKTRIDAVDRKLLKTPWKKILTSVPYIAIVVTQCSNMWGLVTLNTQIPVYFKNILRLDIKSNATLSALPWLGMLCFCILFGSLAMVIEKRCNVATWTLRRIFNAIGELIPMLGMLGLGLLGEGNTIIAVTLVTIAISCNAGVCVSFILSHMDLSPNFAGALMGIANSFSNVMSFLAPLFVGVFVQDVKDPEQWRIVFFFASGYYFLGNLVYIIFGTANVQEWNDSRRTIDQ